MNKVITINLNGRAYQLEEQGYEALRRYLDEARAKLGDNPDKDEIMADFEQAIADKCEKYLSPSKTVVTAKEMEEIIAVMGPVEGAKTNEEKGAGAAGAGANDAAGAGISGSGAHHLKHLFRIREGAWLFGVCNGLAAYFNVDVALVRVLFVLLALVTHVFFGIIIYIILAILMRPAQTDDDVAAAHGAAPFTAHDFFQRIHEEYTKFKDDPNHDPHEFKVRMRQLKKEWRAQRHSWRAEHRAWRDKWNAEQRAKWQEDWRANWWNKYDWHDGAGADAAHRPHPAARAGLGIFSFFMGLIIAAITILWIVALWTFLQYGSVFGYVIGIGHPIWVTLIFLTALYYIALTPFKYGLMSAQCRRWGYNCHYHGWGFVRALFFLIALALLAYTAAELFPAAHTVWSSIGTYLNTPR